MRGARIRPHGLIVAFTLCGLWPLLTFGFSAAAAQADYRELTWNDLLTQPATTPPAGHGPYSSPGPDPWPETSDTNPEAIDKRLATQAAAARRMEQSKGRADLNGSKVAIAGYVVPLEDNPDHAVSEFFLVPYVGACIHVPPPPPDQIVYVTIPRGIAIENIYQAYRVQGTLHRQTQHSGLADTAYTISADSVDIYRPDDQR